MARFVDMSTGSLPAGFGLGPLPKAVHQAPAQAMRLVGRGEALAAAEREVWDALQRAKLKAQDLPLMRRDMEAASRYLGLSTGGSLALERLAARAEAQAEGSDEGLQGQRFDVLNGEGEVIMDRPRAEVHRDGLWHRAVHVWVVCTDTNRVLLGKRAIRKTIDPGRWTCACCRVPSGESSMDTAVECLQREFSLKARPDTDVALAFTARCRRRILRGTFAGQEDNTVADVYIIRIRDEIPVEKVHFEVRCKQAVQYVSLEDLRAALTRGSEEFVIPPDREYTTKLLSHLSRSCEVSSTALKTARARGLSDLARTRGSTDSMQPEGQVFDASTMLCRKTWHTLGVSCEAWREAPVQ